jgi:hypothetical protein
VRATVDFRWVPCAVIAAVLLVAVPATVAVAGYCPESDWDAFYDDTNGVPNGPCSTQSIALTPTGESCATGQWWIRITTTACDGEEPANGGVYAYHSTMGLTLIGSLVDGIWESSCGDWDAWDYFHVYGLDQEISEWRLEAFCCESCCAAMQVSCTTGGSTPSGWYFNGCDCVQWNCIQTCVGDDCDEMFASESACQDFYQEPPHDECLELC